MPKKLSIIPQIEIENRIFTFRGIQVMLDRHLAELYEVETRVINQAVKRNQERFPPAFCVQLTDEEFSNWKSQIVMSNRDKMGLRKSPYVFTEQGVAMLSAVLRSETADEGIFFEGQVFDAYVFITDLIKRAHTNIILIDNYIDETVLTQLAKRETGITVTIYTKQISKQLQLDLKKHNEQYPAIEIKILTNKRDRFILLDHKELYHIGASLKDLGKKWFAFSRMDDFATEILNRIQQNND